MKTQVIYITHIPGVNSKPLLEGIVAEAARHGQQFVTLSTSKLIQYAYRKLDLPDPDMDRILSWDVVAERAILHTALGYLPQYLAEQQLQPHTVLLRSHASFIRDYGKYFKYPAVAPASVAQVAPTMILNIASNPMFVHQNLQQRQQWQQLSVDDLAHWTVNEYQESRSLGDMLRKNHKQDVHNLVIGSDEHPVMAYRMISDPKTPIFYFSYPITGATEDERIKKRQQYYDIKNEIGRCVNIASHEALVLDTIHFDQWPGAREFLRLFQLEMLMPQANGLIAVYCQEDVSATPAVSAGVGAETTRAKQFNMKRYLMHPHPRISPYQASLYDHITSSPTDLYALLGRHGFSPRRDGQELYRINTQ